MRTIRPRIPVILLLLIAGTIHTACAQDYILEDSIWGFRNYGEAEYSWDIYRDAYLGIPDIGNATSASVFDTLFYDYVIKNFGMEGSCYGMSVLSHLIVQNGGYKGLCYPVSQYSGDSAGLSGDFLGPTDSRVRDLISIFMCHQLDLLALEQTMEAFAQGYTRDGLYAFEQAKYYMEREDPLVANITKGVTPTSGGHTVAIYDILDNGPDDKRIYVYDSNRTWVNPTDQTFYTTGVNYIQIRSDHSWEFEMDGGEIWGGDPSSGGNFLVQPISIAGPTSRTPSSLGFNAVTMLNEIFVYGEGASLEQITNSEGKRFLDPATMTVDSNPITGMRTVMPFIPLYLGKSQNPCSAYFMLGNPGGGTLQFYVRGGEKGYQFITAGPRGAVLIQAMDGKGTDNLEIKNIGSIQPELSLSNRSGASAYTVTFMQDVIPGKKIRTFKLKNLKIPPEYPVEMKVIKNQTALSILSEKNKLTYDLQIGVKNDGVEKAVDYTGLELTPGQRHIVQPPDWNVLDQQNAPILKPISAN